MSITLYHNPVSTCSQKVRLVLAEKGLDYESHVIEWTKMEHLSDWYLKINPNGVVPAIVHDSNPVIDSSVIAEYLDEAFPDNPRSAPVILWGGRKCGHGCAILKKCPPQLFGCRHSINYSKKRSRHFRKKLMKIC